MIEHANPAMFSLENPTLWVAVASVTVIALLWRPIGQLLVKALNARVQKVRDDIDQAEKLLAEAKVLLARYTGAMAEAEQESQKIIDQAMREAEDVKKRAMEELDHALAAREKHAMDRIQQAEASAISEIRDATVSLSMRAARTAIQTHLNDNQQDALLQNAVVALKSHLG